jgi:hypothetical protein
LVAKVLWAIVWTGALIVAPLLLLFVLVSYLMAAKLPEKVEVALYLGGIVLCLLVVLVGLVLIWRPFFR